MVTFFANIVNAKRKHYLVFTKFIQLLWHCFAFVIVFKSKMC